MRAFSSFVRFTGVLVFFFVFAVIFVAPALASAAATTTVFTSSGTFTVPANVSEIFVEAVGGGGAGASASGGGGGAYAAATTTVTPGDMFTVTVGGPGADSSFGTIVIAKAGVSGASGGAGGSAAASTGSVKHSGGNGVGSNPGDQGGGGGAGYFADGGNGTTSGGGIGGTGQPPYGGQGGSAADGSDGSVAGGGGAHQFTSAARGVVAVTYTVVVPPDPMEALYRYSTTSCTGVDPQECVTQYVPEITNADFNFIAMWVLFCLSFIPLSFIFAGLKARLFGKNPLW